MTLLKSFHQFRTSLPETCPQSRTLERCLLLIMIVMIMLLHTNVIQRAHWLMLLSAIHLSLASLEAEKGYTKLHTHPRPPERGWWNHCVHCIGTSVLKPEYALKQSFNRFSRYVLGRHSLNSFRDNPLTEKVFWTQWVLEFILYFAPSVTSRNMGSSEYFTYLPKTLPCYPFGGGLSHSRPCSCWIRVLLLNYTLSTLVLSTKCM